MRRDLLEQILSGPFALTSRPEPVPGDLRIAWGIALVVLILGRCRSHKASLLKLHFLAHSVRSEEGRRKVQRLFEGDIRPSGVVIRVEPWLNRALEFAKGAGLIEMPGGKHAKLKRLGDQVLHAVDAEHDLFEEEKEFLDAIKSFATEAAIEKVMRMEVGP